MDNPQSKATLQFRLIGMLGLTLIIGALITAGTMMAFSFLSQDAGLLRQKDDALNDAWALHNLSTRIERSQISYLLMHDQRYIRDNERYRLNFSDLVSERSGLDLSPDLANLYYELERELLAYDNVFSQIQTAGEQEDWELAVERAQSLNVHIVNLQRGSRQLVGYLQPAVEDQLLATSWRLRIIGTVGLVVFLAFTALAVTAGNLVDKRLARPMQHLIQAARHIPMGDFDPQRIQPLMQFGDQLGDLTWAMVQVVEQHQLRKQQLEKQIAELYRQRQQLNDF